MKALHSGCKANQWAILEASDRSIWAILVTDHPSHLNLNPIYGDLYIYSFHTIYTCAFHVCIYKDYMYIYRPRINLPI